MFVYVIIVTDITFTSIQYQSLVKIVQYIQPIILLIARMFYKTDICGSKARLEGHELGLQRDVGSYRSTTNNTDIMLSLLGPISLSS